MRKKNIKVLLVGDRVQHTMVISECSLNEIIRSFQQGRCIRVENACLRLKDYTFMQWEEMK